ncbi:hypothetical protein Tco_1055811 [Tanacetum coccineum]|uniref:Uncharacterized protein n=1 Tax=Tanacetum coccineum TaxID=301880 RepID=A0ABQ5H1L3_9ASTR
MRQAYGADPNVDLLRAFLNLGPARLERQLIFHRKQDSSFQYSELLLEDNKLDKKSFKDVLPISFIMEGIDDEFHFIIEACVGDEGGSPSTKFVNNEALVIDADPLTAVHPLEFAKNIGDFDDAPSEQDEVTLIDRTTAEKTQNQRVSASSKATRKRKQTVKSSKREPQQKVRKFPSAKELKNIADCHFVIAHGIPLLWKRYLKEISLDKNLVISMAKLICNRKEVEKDKAYAELDRKCNEALQDLDKNPLVMDMRLEIKTLQGQVDRLHGEYIRLVLEEKKWVNYEQDPSILHLKVERPESEREKLKSSETYCLTCQGGYVSWQVYNFQRGSFFKKSLDLEKISGYRSSSKKEFDQAGDNLATTSYPSIAEATADPYASLEKLLSKKPKSLRTKPALSNSKPLSLRALVS